MVLDSFHGLHGEISMLLNFLIDLPETVVLLLLCGCYCLWNKWTEVARLRESRRKGKGDPHTEVDTSIFVPTVLIPLTALAVCLGFFDIALAEVSALLYIALHEVGKQHNSKVSKRCSESYDSKVEDRGGNTDKRGRHVRPPTLLAKPSTKRISDTFKADLANAKAKRLETSAQEVILRYTPTKADYDFAQHVAAKAHQCIESLVPEAVVEAIPNGSMAITGDDKIQVDVVVTVEPDILTQRLKDYILQGRRLGCQHKSLDCLLPASLQKTATKMLSERLDFVRYWRSQYGGPECLVALVVPELPGISAYPALIHFAVNAAYPLRYTKTLASVTPRCRDLIKLVITWAKVRSIVNIGRGQPHRYAWAIMVLYYFKRSGASAEVDGSTGITDLFKDFVCFYSDWFDQQGASIVVSLSATVKEAPAEKRIFGLPYIEDPCEPGVDVVAKCSADGIARVKVELRRARAMLSDGHCSHIAELIQKWVPHDGVHQNMGKPAEKTIQKR